MTDNLFKPLIHLSITNLLQFLVISAFIFNNILEFRYSFGIYLIDLIIWVLSGIILTVDLIVTIRFVMLFWKKAEDRYVISPVLIIYGIISATTRFGFLLIFSNAISINTNWPILFASVSSMIFGLLMGSIALSSYAQGQSYKLQALVLGNILPVLIFSFPNLSTVILGIKSFLPLLSAFIFLTWAFDERKIVTREEFEKSANKIHPDVET